MSSLDPGQTILVVEDSPHDFEFLERAFVAARLKNPIHHVEDGDDALDYLLRRGEYADPATSPRPAVVLLDLNLPGTDGRDVLAAVKAHEELRAIPVLVLTTSGDVRDIESCYALGANSYIRKPVTFDGFVEAIQRLTNYWFEISILPPKEEAS